jgi:predicted transcriptional regulator
MRDAGVTQASIAERVGCTQAFVSRIIARRGVVRPTKKSEQVWRAIEKALSNGRTR